MTRLITMLESDKPWLWGQPLATVVVLSLASVALFFGVLYAGALGNILKYDQHVYVDVANNLVSQRVYSYDGITPTAYRAPGYAFFNIYPVFLLGGEIVHVRMVQFVFLALSIVLVHKILYLWSYRLAGVIAGVFAFCYPVLFYTAGELFPQTVTAFLLLLTCYLVVRRQGSIAGVLFGGIAYGCLVLTTPAFLVILPVLIVMWLWVWRFRAAFLGTGLFLLAAALVITPWVIRNYVVFNEVFIATNSASMLVYGISARAPSNGRYRESVALESAKEQGVSEAELYKLYRAEAMNWMSNNKTEAIKMYVRKFMNHFHFHNRVVEHSENTVWRDVVMFVTYYPLLMLAILRIIRGGKLGARPYEVFAMVSYLMIGAVYAMFFTRIRYRLPVDWMLISVAAIYAASLLESVKGRMGGTASK